MLDFLRWYYLHQDIVEVDALVIFVGEPNNFSLEEQEITDEILLLGLKEVLSTFAHQIK